MIIYNVIKHRYVDYAENSHTTIMSCDSIEKAREHALECYKENYHNTNRNDSFDSYSFFESVLDIFKRPSPYAKDYVLSFYVVEVELNKPMTKNDKVVWELSEKDVFDFFKNDIEIAFSNDVIEQPSNEEVSELFNIFKNNRKSLTRPFTRELGYENKDAAELIAMTSTNEEDTFMYNQYEK